MMTPRYWAVMPAAGVGRRMGAEVPKQYLMLNDRPVIEHALQTLVDYPAIDQVIVAIATSDRWWDQLRLSSHPRVHRVAGGSERAESVLNGLLALKDQANAMDWVLVHDAARPCLHRSDLDKLIQTLNTDPVGGLLGVPLNDTIKRSDDAMTIMESVPRERLWRAFTPQMFRYGALRVALEQARDDNRSVTDEANAMELAGAHPRLVEGLSDNIKITRQEDLMLAQFYLAQRRGD